MSLLSFSQQSVAFNRKPFQSRRQGGSGKRITKEWVSSLFGGCKEDICETNILLCKTPTEFHKLYFVEGTDKSVKHTWYDIPLTKSIETSHSLLRLLRKAFHENVGKAANSRLVRKIIYINFVVSYAMSYRVKVSFPGNSLGIYLHLYSSLKAFTISPWKHLHET